MTLPGLLPCRQEVLVPKRFQATFLSCKLSSKSSVFNHLWNVLIEGGGLPCLLLVRSILGPIYFVLFLALSHKTCFLSDPLFLIAFEAVGHFWPLEEEYNS